MVSAETGLLMDGMAFREGRRVPAVENLASGANMLRMADTPGIRPDVRREEQPWSNECSACPGHAPCW